MKICVFNEVSARHFVHGYGCAKPARWHARHTHIGKTAACELVESGLYEWVEATRRDGNISYVAIQPAKVLSQIRER